MQQTGWFTGKKVYAPDFKEKVTIGKISGYRGTGEPVYDLIRNGKKCGEMGNNRIKENRKKYK